jgi:hypothetical protein
LSTYTPTPPYTIDDAHRFAATSAFAMKMFPVTLCKSAVTYMFPDAYTFPLVTVCVTMVFPVTWSVVIPAETAGSPRIVRSPVDTRFDVHTLVVKIVFETLIFDEEYRVVKLGRPAKDSLPDAYMFDDHTLVVVIAFDTLAFPVTSIVVFSKRPANIKSPVLMTFVVHTFVVVIVFETETFVLTKF